MIIFSWNPVPGDDHGAARVAVWLHCLQDILHNNLHQSNYKLHLSHCFIRYLDLYGKDNKR